LRLDSPAADGSRGGAGVLGGGSVREIEGRREGGWRACVRGWPLEARQKIIALLANLSTEFGL
jgi:hypothetical protein